MTTLDDLYNNYGQSPWLDNLRLDWVEDGTLANYIAEGVRGVTSNPSIFAKAFASTSAYDEAISASSETDPEKLFETLAVATVRDACDLLTDVHANSRKDFDGGNRRYLDGFVSLEVSPSLAHDLSLIHI